MAEDAGYWSEVNRIQWQSELAKKEARTDEELINIRCETEALFHQANVKRYERAKKKYQKELRGTLR
jgi:hypothetical protein